MLFAHFASESTRRELIFNLLCPISRLFFSASSIPAYGIIPTFTRALNASSFSILTAASTANTTFHRQRNPSALAGFSTTHRREHARLGNLPLSPPLPACEKTVSQRSRSSKCHATRRNRSNYCSCSERGFRDGKSYAREEGFHGIACVRVRELTETASERLQFALPC